MLKRLFSITLLLIDYYRENDFPVIWHRVYCSQSLLKSVSACSWWIIEQLLYCHCSSSSFILWPRLKSEGFFSTWFSKALADMLHKVYLLKPDSQGKHSSWEFCVSSHRSDQIRSVTQSCPTLCDPMNRSTPGLPVHHQLSEFTQTHVHRVSNAIQPSHPLSSSSPLAPNPSQHQGLFQWINSSHEVAKVLEFQL